MAPSSVATGGSRITSSISSLPLPPAPSISAKRSLAGSSGSARISRRLPIMSRRTCDPAQVFYRTKMNGGGQAMLLWRQPFSLACGRSHWLKHGYPTCEPQFAVVEPARTSMPKPRCSLRCLNCAHVLYVVHETGRPLLLLWAIDQGQDEAFWEFVDRSYAGRGGPTAASSRSDCRVKRFIGMTRHNRRH